MRLEHISRPVVERFARLWLFRLHDGPFHLDFQVSPEATDEDLRDLLHKASIELAVAKLRAGA